MLQVVQDFKSGRIRVVEVPPPALAPGMVLVETRASAISVGTERATVDVGRKTLLGKARARPDLVRKTLETLRKEGLTTTLKKVRSRLEEWKPLGYSSAGIVRAVGEGVERLSPGMPVACGGGGFAVHSELALVPQNLCVPIPEGVSFEDAAFATLSAIALQGLRQAEVRTGDRVVVLGLGLIGLLAVGLLRASGAFALGMDIRESALEWGEKMGMDDGVLLGRDDPVKRTLAWSRGRGADAVLITTATRSKDPLRLAPQLLRDRGRIVVVGVAGLELDREPFYLKELDLRFSRSYGPGRYDPLYEEKGIDYPIGYVRWTEGRNIEATLDLMARGLFRPSQLVTHRFAIEEAERAYALLLEGKEPVVGVLFTYPKRGEPQTPTLTLHPRKRTGKLGIGIIGAGNFARAYLIPEIARFPEGEIRILATAHGHTARMVGERYGVPEVTTDPLAVIHHPDVELVFILTRHHLHAPLLLEALKAGKKVYVEKPMVRTSEELQALARWVEAHPEAWVMVGFNRVFSPHFRFLRESFHTFPQFLFYRVNAGPLPPDHWLKDPVEGGGRWVGEGCHFLHFALHWMGKPPEDFALRGVPVEGEHADENLSLFLDFGDRGSFALLYTTRGAKDYPKEHLEVWGDGLTGLLEDFRHSRLFPGKRRLHTRGQDKGHREEIRKTLAAARHGGPPPLPWDELLETHRWLFRIREALYGRESGP